MENMGTKALYRSCGNDRVPVLPLQHIYLECNENETILIKGQWTGELFDFFFFFFFS